MRKILLTPLAVVVLACLNVMTAHADAAGDAARSLLSNPVYVAPGASGLSSSDAASLASQIRGSGRPIYLAVLPSGSGNVDDLPHAIAVDIGGNHPGVFGVVEGNSFRAGASPGQGFNSGEANSLAGQAARDQSPARYSGGLQPMLSDFITLVANHRSAPVASTGGSSGSGDSHVGLILFIIFGSLGLIALGVGGYFWWRRRQAFQAARSVLSQRVNRIGSELISLEVDVALNDKAKNLHADAWMQQKTARDQIDNARSMDDLDEASVYASTAETILSKVRVALEPPQDEKEIVVTAKPAKKKAATKASKKGPEVERPAGVPSQTTVVFRDERSSAYPNYWPGGVYNGYWYGPGWYPSDPLLNFMIMDSILDNQRDYDRGYDAGRDAGRSYDSGNSGGGDWSSPASVPDSGGGDWSSPSPSFSDSSWGGGGGGDFGGGGGGDFGGGGGGGGDW